jgi:hypothetical protein
MLGDLFFGTVDENAEREYANYKPGKGRKKDLGDRLGDSLTGRGSAIDRAVEQLHIDKLKSLHSTQLQQYRNIPGLDVPTITKDTDAKLLQQQVDLLAGKARDYKDAQLYAAKNNVTLDPTKFTDPIAMIAEVNNQVEQKGDTKKTEEENKVTSERRYQELREDKRDERSRLDRLQLQQQNNEYRRDSLNLEYARMARQDRQTAQDRKDKAIMMLVQGLGNLGIGFTA